MSQSNFHRPSNVSRPFETTCWSVVIRAGQDESHQSRQALEYLCQRYWYPLYRFVLKQVGDPHDAQDLTQAFFSQLIQKNQVAKADQQKGRFRSFLLTAIQNFVRNEWQKLRTQKRGGGAVVFSIDFSERPECRDNALPISSARTPQQDFERRWAIELLQSAMSSLELEYRQQGKNELFTQLKPTISAWKQLPPFRELASNLKMSENHVKVAAHRLREKFRNRLRLLIAETLDDADEIEDEIQLLFASFSKQ